MVTHRANNHFDCSIRRKEQQSIQKNVSTFQSTCIKTHIFLYLTATAIANTILLHNYRRNCSISEASAIPLSRPGTMLWTNFTAALAAIAGTTMTMRDVGKSAFFSANTTLSSGSAQSTGQPNLSKYTDVCNMFSSGHKLRFMPRDQSSPIEKKGDVWYVYEEELLRKKYVGYGEYARVANVTGASAIFYFSEKGLAFVAHIPINKEAEISGNSAALIHKSYAIPGHQFGPPPPVNSRGIKSIQVHTPNHELFRVIEDATRQKLHRTFLDIQEHLYDLNADDRNQRWMFTYRAGDTSNKVEVESYQCS